MKFLFLILTALASQAAYSANTDIWEGSGALFDLSGNQTGTYNLQVEKTHLGNKTQADVTVTLPNGTIYKHQCIMSDSNQTSWTSVCDHGKGGGHCFGEGLCISYEEDGTGKAYATNITLDGSSDMRLLRTELLNGKAVRFFREKLHKK